MNYLLDTHILIWYFGGSLSDKARTAIFNSQNEIYYSPLSIYEIDLKHSKHPENMPITGAEIVSFCEEAGFKVLPFTEKHALEMKNLKRYENTPPHNDLFDKMILSQAIVENMQLMTHDNRIAEYDCLNVYKV